MLSLCVIEMTGSLPHRGTLPKVEISIMSLIPFRLYNSEHISTLALHIPIPPPPRPPEFAFGGRLVRDRGFRASGVRTVKRSVCVRARANNNAQIKSFVLRRDPTGAREVGTDHAHVRPKRDGESGIESCSTKPEPPEVPFPGVFVFVQQPSPSGRASLLCRPIGYPHRLRTRERSACEGGSVVKVDAAKLKFQVQRGEGAPP